MLPVTVQDNDTLLTINSNDAPVYKDILVPGLDVQPLYLDPTKGIWALRVFFHPGVKLPTHYHTGTVHFWTLSGRWNYVEHPDQPQTAGSYLFEPGGSIHTFNVPEDNKEVTETVMIIEGANVNFDENGEYHSILDASSIMAMIEACIQERGLDPSMYITTPMANHADKISR
ncbi:2,4'-dihydroxyacetophenone dioxygenase family protein [Marinobacter sp. F4216]|uniref:2,4'-dihydroxyacetophenone dioxygenase family protein n=1 Tax=Marinobacter sp. F4216 TaxID=2874281 RepID=UPI001CBCA909|nr:2,4'-dihydroxyacetophenone dioxygenase family protein [Marinobacter sp. F4216]MBZ2169099.1 2,4'-dihydroxyacetophenone dioxygenase family protein [Marinobacter sp. F4216]